MDMKRILDSNKVRGFGLVFVCSALFAGCDSEPPAPGDLVVTSEPLGATIAIDGYDTGKVTPHTFEGLDGGVTYTIAVTVDGFFSSPSERSLEVPSGSSARADFTLAQVVGSLAVTSEPAGATILINGNDTGEVTPYTFGHLIPGDYTVAVELANYICYPAEIVVTVMDGETATADFILVLENVPRIVLLESFSNVYCVGCPAMNANIEFVQQQEDYGPERLLHVKWPAMLSPLDPFYWVTPTITNDRVAWYFGSSQINLPTLVGDGALLGGMGTPVDADGMMVFIDGQPDFADFRVTVSTDEDLDDVADLTHECTVTLRSADAIDLSGHHLNVVLVYEVVETENQGYIDGITEYHWVMRDHVQPSTDLGVLTAGVSYPFDITLSDPLGGELEGHAVYPQNKQIIAWVQHATSRVVLQAGSTMTAAPPTAVPDVPNRAP